MGTRILRGRGMGPEDVAGAPRAVVVSSAMAKALWPGQDALGQCMRIGADTMPCTYVVGLALVLATIGLYGVIAYNVTQRSHEMGVRIALGARAQDVVWLVVRQGVLLGGVGVALGGAIALAAAGWLEPLLFDESPRDALVYGLVAAAMLAVAAAASFIPARRASRVDPNVALRSE